MSLATSWGGGESRCIVAKQLKCCPKINLFAINQCILLQLQLQYNRKKRCAGKIKITISSQQQIVDGKIKK